MQKIQYNYDLKNYYEILKTKRKYQGQGGAVYCRLYMYVIDTNMYVIFQYAASTAFYSFTVVGSCMAVSDSG